MKDEGLSWFLSLVLSTVMAVTFTAWWAYTAGKETLLKSVVTNCKEHQVFVHEGLLLQCAIVHKVQ